MAVVHVLLLLLLTAFTALTEPVSDVFVEVKRDAVLQCGKVQDGQHRCNLTSWVYSNPKASYPPVEFIALGNRRPGSNDRFSLTESCSVVLKNVFVADAVMFSCKQHDRSGREVSVASTMLSVYYLAEYDAGLFLYVSSPHDCTTIQTRCFYDHSEITEDHPFVRKQDFPCGANLVYRNVNSSALQKELFKCEINHNNKKYTCRVQSEASEKPPNATDSVRNRNDTGESSTLPENSHNGTDSVNNRNDTGESSSTLPGDERHETTEETPPTRRTEGLLLRNVLLSVGLLLLLALLCVAALLIYARVKGSRASGRSCSSVNRGGAVLYETLEEPSASVRLHNSQQHL